MSSNRHNTAKAYAAWAIERKEFMNQIATDINQQFNIIHNYTDTCNLIYNFPNNLSVQLCFNQSSNSWFALGFYNSSIIERSDTMNSAIEAFEVCLKKTKYFLLTMIKSLPKRINANQII